MNKNYLLYGSFLGLGILLIQIFKYKTMINDVSIELFGFIIALLFIAIGLWLGHTFFKKSNTHETYLSTPTSELSNREVEVLELLANGLSNQEIADSLFISINTTKTHIAKLYQKLNVTRRTQAVQKAHQEGILRREIGKEFSKSPKSMSQKTNN